MGQSVSRTWEIGEAEFGIACELRDERKNSAKEDHRAEGGSSKILGEKRKVRSHLLSLF